MHIFEVIEHFKETKAHNIHAHAIILHTRYGNYYLILCVQYLINNHILPSYYDSLQI